jgi:hypothetical protein
MATLKMAPTRRERTSARAVVITTTGQMTRKRQHSHIHIPTSLNARHRRRNVVDEQEDWLHIDLFTTEGDVNSMYVVDLVLQLGYAARATVKQQVVREVLRHVL